jgi:glycosyltransferase involved in cell wall biosynthesis
MFLWVGRLEENKDPLTVLAGLKDFLITHVHAEFLMIYQNDKLLPEIKNYLSQYPSLIEKVKLLGEIPNKELNYYYSAADYFVLGSHYEGSGFALIESVAYGCIPLVTDIPSFRKITNNSTLGALWTVKDSASLKHALEKVLKKDSLEESEKIEQFFKQELSFEAIAAKQMDLIKTLIQKN